MFAIDVGTFPFRNGGCPKTIPRDAPIGCGFKNIFEPTFFEMLGMPGYLLVAFEQLRFNFLDVDKPRVNSVIEEWSFTAIAEGIRMCIIVGFEEQGTLFRSEEHT